MEKIIADFVVRGTAGEVIAQLHNAILPVADKKLGYRISQANFVATSSRCHVCKKDLALVLTHVAGGDKDKEPGDEVHLILNPCTRVVLGIHPDNKNKMVRTFPDASLRKFHYLCHCRALRIPEYVYNCGVKQLAGRLCQDPIIDMPAYESDKGCWITATEFPGRFMNLQVSLDEYVRIMHRMSYLF
jgi:hypothetical protein